MRTNLTPEQLRNILLKKEQTVPALLAQLEQKDAEIHRLIEEVKTLKDMIADAQFYGEQYPASVVEELSKQEQKK